MGRTVLLDAGPLGLVCGPPLSAAARDARSRLARLESSVPTVLVPDVAAYEVRRELVRRGARVQLARLDDELGRLGSVLATAEAWEADARFWAAGRRAGLPTAGPDRLDADAVHAGVAATMAGPDDVVEVATRNPAHLGRYVPVIAWDFL